MTIKNDDKDLRYTSINQYQISNSLCSKVGQKEPQASHKELLHGYGNFGVPAGRGEFS